jgi:hypothetical protein
MAETKRIDESDPLKWYRELVRHALDSGSAPGFSERREQVAKALLMASQRENLLALDEEALEYVLELPELDDELLQDDLSQPLEKWWWHLGTIRRGTYPVELLPQSVRAIYPLGVRAA